MNLIFYIDEADRYVKTVRHDSGIDRLEGGAGDDVFLLLPRWWGMTSSWISGMEGTGLCFPRLKIFSP